MLKSMVLLGGPPFFWTLETNCNAKAGIPMAPTIFAFKGKRTPAKLLKEIKVRISWWKNHHFLLGESWIVVLHDPPYTGWSLERKHQKACLTVIRGKGLEKLRHEAIHDGIFIGILWLGSSQFKPGGVLAVTLNIFYKIRSFPTFSIFCTLGSISCTWLTLIEASEANCPSRSARRTKPISNCTPLTHMIWVLCPRTCDALWQDPSILKKYFKEYAECPEYVVQASVSQGFCVNKLQITGRCCRSALMALLEIGRLAFSGSMVSFCSSACRVHRDLDLWTCCYMLSSLPRYAIANKAAVSTEDCVHGTALQLWRGQKCQSFCSFPGWHRGHCHRPATGLPRRQQAFCGILWAGDDIPEEFLENAKRIGKEALKAGGLRWPLGPSKNQVFIASDWQVLPQLTAPSGESIPMSPDWKLVLLKLDDFGRLLGRWTSESQDPDPNWYWLLR